MLIIYTHDRAPVRESEPASLFMRARGNLLWCNTFLCLDLSCHHRFARISLQMRTESYVVSLTAKVIYKRIVLPKSQPTVWFCNRPPFSAVGSSVPRRLYCQNHHSVTLRTSSPSAGSIWSSRCIV